MQALREEAQPLGCGREELLAILDRALRDAETVVRAIDPATLEQPRGGRTEATAHHRNRPVDAHRGAHAAAHRSGDQRLQVESRGVEVLLDALRFYMCYM